MDDDLKRAFESACDDMGMPMAVAMVVFAKRVARDRRIPFDVSAPADPFYSDSNMRALKHSMQQAKEGKTVTKTLAELEKMEDD